MGFAVHLVGDIYAHRTMVPENDTKITAETFVGIKKEWWEIYRQKRSHFVIETRDLKNFGLDTGDFEDNRKDFYKQRFNASNKSVGNILTLYSGDKAFSPHAIFIAGVGYTLKLNNLRAYGESNGYVNVGLDAISTDVYRVNANHKNPSLRVFNNETDCGYYDYFIC